MILYLYLLITMRRPRARTWCVSLAEWTTPRPDPSPEAVVARVLGAMNRDRRTASLTWAPA